MEKTKEKDTFKDVFKKYKLVILVLIIISILSTVNSVLIYQYARMLQTVVSASDDIPEGYKKIVEELKKDNTVTQTADTI